MSNDNDTFLDELPAGASQSEQPKKKSVKKVAPPGVRRKKVRRKKRPSPEPLEALPTDEPSEPQMDFEEDQAFDDPELGMDIPDAEHTDLGEPVMEFDDGEVEEAPPDISDEKDFSPAMQEELATPSKMDGLLPAPVEKKDTPAPVTLDTLPVPQGGTAPATSSGRVAEDPNVDRKWDEFLLSLNQATLTAVWELGISSITEFKKFSRGDLLRPRGRLTEGQVNEVEGWLNRHGVYFGVGSSRSLHRGRGRQVGQGGLRVPAHRQEPLPTNATVSQKRNHRLQRNRLTM